MTEAVKSGGGFLDVPIVEEIVVEKCASDERTHIRLNSQEFRKPHAHFCDSDGVFVCSHVSVLDEFSLFSEVF